MYYGKKVILRSIELSDVDDILPYFNTLEYRRTIGGVLPYTKEQEEEWVKSTWEGRMKGNPYIFGIALPDDRLIGTVSLFKVDKIHKNAELGIGIHDPNDRNKGYGTDAVLTICAFGFLHLNLHSIYLRYIEYNKNGARAYQKAGFTQTGIERDMIFRDGNYHNFVRMDILEREFLEKFPDYTLYKA